LVIVQIGCTTVAQSALLIIVKSLKIRDFINFICGADENDLTPLGRTLSSTGYPARKTKMLLSRHLAYLMPFAYAS